MSEPHELIIAPPPCLVCVCARVCDDDEFAHQIEFQLSSYDVRLSLHFVLSVACIDFCAIVNTNGFHGNQEANQSRLYHDTLGSPSGGVCVCVCLNDLCFSS